MRMWLALIAMLFINCDAGAENAASSDGQILTTTACASAAQTYREWLAYQEKDYVAETNAGRDKFGIEMKPFSALRPALQSEEEFDRRRNEKSFTCERITYLSDGLTVVGYIWRPVNVTRRKLPLIVYNRGGGQELGRLKPTMRDGFYDFLASGFVVIGSQYRGNDGGEGHDEEGGAEIADVLNILPLARSLDYIDMANVFMLGESRGGMMTFLAMKNGARVNAAAVVGAETDLAASLIRRPELEEDNAKQIPQYSATREQALRQRSAQAWPEQLMAPILMLQGGKDWRVSPPQALGLALKLDELKKPFELTVFADDGHPLFFHWRERDRRIIDWFRAHLRTTSKESEDVVRD